MAVSKKNKACLPAGETDHHAHIYSHKKAKLRDPGTGRPKRKSKTSRSNPAGERSRSPIADSIETVVRGLAHLVPLRRIHACKDPNCAPRQRFSLLPARERGPIERGRRRAQEQEEEDEEEPTTGWDGRGEGGGMPCGWPEWNCSPLL